MRLRTEGRERGTLKERPGHLFGPQAGHREDGPGFLLRFGGRVGHRAIESKDLGGGDGANETVEVIAVCGEIVGEAAQSRMELAGGAEVVDGLGQRPANRRAQTRLTVARLKFGFRGSTTQAASCSRGFPLSGNSSGQNGTRGSTLTGCFGLVVGGRVIVFGVMDAPQVGVDAAEKRRQSAKIGLLPGLKWMVVALGAVDPSPQKRSRHPRGQPVGGRPARFRVERDRDEIGRGVIGPETAVGDQLGDERVVAGGSPGSRRSARR